MNRVHSHYALLMMSEMSPVAAAFFVIIHYCDVILSL